MKKNSGQSLAFALIILTVLLIFIPSLVNMLTRETNWSLGHKRSTVAFHLAEAAIDRGIWKLRESDSVWDSVEEGTLSNDYLGVKEFTDVKGGKYKVIISSTEYANERMIVGIGRDDSTEEVRAIEVIVFAAGTVESPLQVASIKGENNMTAFWGPIMARGSIVLEDEADQLYPRKYARGQILGDQYGDRDDNPGGNNTDNLEWWSYYPVPELPDINFKKYKLAAEADNRYWAGNKTYEDHVNLSTLTYYCVGDFKLEGNCFIRGDIIVLGDLTIEDKGTEALWVKPPDTAWMEYQKNTPGAPDFNGGADAADDSDYSDGDDAEGDSAAEDEYPGDGGYHVSKFFWLGDEVDDGGNKDNPVSIDGFVYCGGDLKAEDDACIYGAVMVGDAGSMGEGNFELYYNAELDIEVSCSKNFQRTSWKEIKYSW
ncbi:pilus assembly PilX N-terminal domain-containing protein [Elusimicrobiota bacterium]